MRPLSQEFQAHLDTATTTLCMCWRIIRPDGVTLGFTDHDRALQFEGTTFKADTGGTPSALASSADLSVDNATVEGALNDEGLTEIDLEAGRYDYADVEIFRVNWLNPDLRLLLKKGTLGEVKRGPSAYQVEFRGLTSLLDQTVGRLYQHSCDAVLGDARCRVDISAAAFTGQGQVSGVIDKQTFLVTGLQAYSDRWFSQGVVQFTTGENQGVSAQVKSHARRDSEAELQLWQPLVQPASIGNDFSIRAGCDKRFGTCREKFTNGHNFRGMPHIPGNDVITSYPLRGEANDGGKR